MYTLYLSAGQQPGLEGQNLEGVLSITRKVMPTAGADLRLTRQLLPEVNGGFFILYSELTARLFDHFSNPELTVVFYGELFDSAIAGVAERIASTWTEGGNEAVHRLNGLFSAIIIDKRNIEVHLLSDAIGIRTCRYRSTDDGALHISTQDVPLMAVGGLEPELDRTSACACLSYEWSVGGYSLQRGIQKADCNSHLTWNKNGIVAQPASSLIGDDRIISMRDPNLVPVIDEMLEMMRDAIRVRTNNAESVCVDLTAGFDSRAILAVANSVVGNQRIAGRTNGSLTTLDGKVATKLADRIGTGSFSILEPDTGLDAKIPWYSDAMGFGLNGDFCSKGVWLPSHTMTDLEHPHLSGAGGEMFRGFFYPTTEPDQFSRISPLQALHDSHFEHSRDLPWASADDLKNYKARLENVVAKLQQISPHPTDVLDLFFALESTAHWASHQERHPLRSASLSTFKQPGLASLGFRLPPGIAALQYLHAEAVERFAPQLRHILVNGEFLAVPLNAKPARRLHADLTTKSIKYAKRMYEFLPWRLRERLRNDADSYMTDLFTGPLSEYTHDSLLTEDSISLQLFTRSSVNKMLDDHPSRCSYVEQFGQMLTMNSWWQQIKQAYSLSKQS